MTGPSETQILCEGFHDRAFWAGLLEHLGCSDQGYKPNTPGFPQQDPWGTRIGGGQYAYASRSKQFIRVVPCHGKSNVLPAMRDRLKTRAAKYLLRLVVNVDPDVSAGGNVSTTGLQTQDILRAVQGFDSAAQLTSTGEIAMDGGATKVALIRWEAADPPAPGIPDPQTLERLVCSAVVAAYSTRAQCVHDWLKSRSPALPTGPKEYAWSYMAGWYADYGCEAFYTQLWNDPPIAHELQSRLTASGAWQLVDAIAQ